VITERNLELPRVIERLLGRAGAVQTPVTGVGLATPHRPNRATQWGRGPSRLRVITSSLATALVYGWGGALAVHGTLNVGTVVAPSWPCSTGSTDRSGFAALAVPAPKLTAHGTDHRVGARPLPSRAPARPVAAVFVPRWGEARRAPHSHVPGL
jgi:hypothetical protein